jgi:hypothetical protein
MTNRAMPRRIRRAEKVLRDVFFGVLTIAVIVYHRNGEITG